MQHVSLGLDLDDVLIATVPHVIRIYNSRYGAHATINDWNNTDAVPNWGVGTVRELFERIVDILSTEEYIKSVPPIEGACEAIGLLKTQGATLRIITGRPESLRNATQATIDRVFGGMFSPKDLYFVDHYDYDGKKITKLSTAIDLGLTHFVDDQVDHVSPMSGTSVTPILFTQDYPWNSEFEDTTVPACRTWSDIVAILRSAQ